MEPKVSYDEAADVLYIRFSDEPADKAVELDYGVVVRYAKGVPVGITILARYDLLPLQYSR